MVMSVTPSSLASRMGAQMSAVCSNRRGRHSGDAPAPCGVAERGDDVLICGRWADHQHGSEPVGNRRGNTAYAPRGAAIQHKGVLVKRLPTGSDSLHPRGIRLPGATSENH